MSDATEPLVEAIARRVVELLKGDTAPSIEPKLLDMRRGAEYLGIGMSTLRQRVQSGEVPRKATRRFGKRIFLVKPELDKWLEQR